MACHRHVASESNGTTFYTDPRGRTGHDTLSDGVRTQERPPEEAGVLSLCLWPPQGCRSRSLEGTFPQGAPQGPAEPHVTALQPHCVLLGLRSQRSRTGSSVL